MGKKFLDWLFNSKVVILFVFLCLGAAFASGKSAEFIVVELFTRIARNSFIVLALIIPVIAGMGLNFGIVIGAMSAQIALFLVSYWGLTGVTGFFAMVALSTPISMLTGFLVGSLFNQMKGNEMIGGLVLGYFAEGIYQFIFLFLFGGLIAMDNPTLMIATGVGVKNTIDLKDTIKYALDTIPMLRIVEVGFYLVVAGVVCSTLIKLVKKQQIAWVKVVIQLAVSGVVYALTFVPSIERFLSQDRLVLLSALELVCFGTVIVQVVRIILAQMKIKKAAASGEELAGPPFNFIKAIVNIAVVIVVYVLTYIPAVESVVRAVKLPVMTYVCIAGLCGFNNILLKTRLGQNMRTVGQDRVVANSSGINVNKTRIIAMIFSTVLAGWGQLILLQNMGTFSTYGAHTQVGQFAIASLLVGGASIQKATNKQAILGVILFHTLFIVSPLAGQELFGNAAVGEYFRLFVSYAVIAMALAMHAWKKPSKVKVEVKAEDKKDAGQLA